MKRRHFLKAGLWLAAGLVVSRLTYGPFDPPPEHATGPYPYAFLTGKDLALFAALIPVVLAGTRAAGDAAARDRLLQALDQALALPAPEPQDEWRNLIRLLEFPPARRLLAGVGPHWHEAEPTDIASFLTRWRDSRFGVLNLGYAGLVGIIKGAWYGLPEAFEEIGYPGPPPYAVQALFGEAR